MFSSLRAFSDEEWQRLDAWLDRIYEDFTGRSPPAAACRWTASTTSPAAGCGRVPMPRSTASSTSSAGCALPSTWRGSGRDPRVRGCPAPGLSACPLVARLRPAQSSEDPRRPAPVSPPRLGPIRRAGGAPRLSSYGPLTLPITCGGEAVAHRPGSDLGAAGHPELGQDVGDVHRRRARGDVQAASKLELLSPSASSTATSRSPRAHRPWRSGVETLQQRVDLGATPPGPAFEQRSRPRGALHGPRRCGPARPGRGRARGTPLPASASRGGRHVAGSAVEKGDDLGVVGGGAGDECSGCHLVVLREVVRLRRLEGREYVGSMPAAVASTTPATTSSSQSKDQDSSRTSVNRRAAASGSPRRPAASGVVTTGGACRRVLAGHGGSTLPAVPRPRPLGRLRAAA